ncbi:MAG: AAA family ATPase [Bacteroidales bacterium]|nr:AAA family ATPase [Bacteroidales bacterium]
MKIIGITGTIGAGKGTIVDYLVQRKNFKHYSVRNFLIEEIKKQTLPINRDSMTMVANNLRKTHNPSYITDCLYEEALKNRQNAVIESIRTYGEVLSLRKHSNFYLFAIDADIAERYRRVVKRNSETDHISFEEFKASEYQEMNNTDPNKQNISKCISEADFLFNNNKQIEDLYKEVEQVLAKIL